MNYFKMPLLNGMFLSISKPVVPVSRGDLSTHTPRPRFSTTVDDLKDISVALLHYRGYLKKKGQEEKAERIASIDHQIFRFLSLMEIEAEA